MYGQLHLLLTWQLVRPQPIDPVGNRLITGEMRQTPVDHTSALLSQGAYGLGTASKSEISLIARSVTDM